MRTSSSNIQSLKPGEIFVFGSNLSGIHAGGAARLATEKFGAEWGTGKGLTGNCYALPTINYEGHTLSIEDIKEFVDEFIFFAETHPDLVFLVTEIGCGIAGHKVEDIAPLFFNATDMNNIQLPARFWDYYGTLIQDEA